MKQYNLLIILPGYFTVSCKTIDKHFLSIPILFQVLIHHIPTHYNTYFTLII